MSNFRLVYSTDPKDKSQCPRCKKNLTECRCIPIDKVETSKIIAKIRLEKSGRGGKTVTVIFNLPRNEEFLKSLSKEMKVKCGVGGTYFVNQDEGIVEIQGDQRETVKKILTTKSIQFKGM